MNTGGPASEMTVLDIFVGQIAKGIISNEKWCDKVYESAIDQGKTFADAIVFDAYAIALTLLSERENRMKYSNNTNAPAPHGVTA